MKNMMRYKGHFGSIEFDENEPVFYGKLMFIRSLVSYEAENAKELIEAFHNAVDDYLETCKETNVEPEKSFKGSLNVRIGQDLHEQIAIAANEKNMSLNEFIKTTLAHKVLNSHHH